MKFGPVPLKDALGAVLAHRESITDGRSLPKGHALTSDDLIALQKAGLSDVTVARLEDGDVDENRAAAMLAQALIATHPHLRLSVATTGRVNVIADAPGLAGLDAAAIHTCNRVNPMITIATVPPLTRMEPRGLIATIKIISYAVPAADLARATAAAQAAIHLHVPSVAAAALIETQIGRPLSDKGMRALGMRLDRLGVGFTGRTLVNHDAQTIAETLKNCDAPLICILTGSATSDLYDTAPTALRLAGGTVAHFGMPVDPGNLLFIGQLDGRPVIGLPGCARSPALNGADWVLERLLCGLPVTPDDIAAMGVGGLLKEIPTRPQPRRASVIPT